MGEIVEYLPNDKDAKAIGEVYRKAVTSIVESVRWQIECGKMLAGKKESLGHGGWLPWLKQQKDLLGFGESTARRLIAASNQALAHDLAPEEATAISRKTWGHANVIATKWTGEETWYTPARYVEAARQAMGGIDLDPASSEFAQKTIKAARYYTREDDGLEQPWNGRVFLNPPYQMPEIRKFVERICMEYSDGNIDAGILLTNNNTDTGWWHMAMIVSGLCCCTEGRISFYNDDGESSAPTNGQTFFYFGSNNRKFKKVFSGIGIILNVA